MKNISLILNVVLGAALAYFLFKDKPTQKNEPTAAAQQEEPADCKNYCMDFTGNSDYTIIEGTTVREMARAYKNTPGLNPDDARSVWFELDDLKKFIWNLQNSICKQNCNTDNLKLGVRIYYARYPQTGPGAPEPFNGLPPEYTAKHTVFMVPTYEARSGVNQDFYMDKSFANCLPVGIPADGNIDPVGLVMPIGKNHGTLCPPVCDGAAFEH